MAREHSCAAAWRSRQPLSRVARPSDSFAQTHPHVDGGSLRPSRSVFVRCMASPRTLQRSLRDTALPAAAATLRIGRCPASAGIVSPRARDAGSSKIPGRWHPRPTEPDTAPAAAVAWSSSTRAAFVPPPFRPVRPLHPPFRASSPGSRSWIQCRTGTDAAVARCARQPMFAVAIASGRCASRLTILRPSSARERSGCRME